MHVDRTHRRDGNRKGDREQRHRMHGGRREGDRKGDREQRHRVHVDRTHRRDGNRKGDREQRHRMHGGSRDGQGKGTGSRGIGCMGAGWTGIGKGTGVGWGGRIIGDKKMK